MSDKITPITPAQPEDSADLLAKDIIARLCDSANKFLQQQNRVIPGARSNPLGGFRLPFAPLANQIRLTAEKLLAPAPVVAATDEHLDAWFGKDTKPAGEIGAHLNADIITAALNGKPLQLSKLATVLNADPEAVLAIINSPDSGLVVSGPAKWVKAA